MDREEFERLRDLPGKVIEGDIILQHKRDASPVLVSDRISILNSDQIDATITVRLNSETDEKTINVYITGIGPICRLDVDSNRHRNTGRSHKHALASPTCPSENLKRKVHERSDLAGKEIEVVFREFCRQANIEHRGTIKTSDE